MRLIILTSTFLLLFQTANCQTLESKSGAFPTNIDSASFHLLKKYHGDIIAFDGQIKEIKNSRNNTPFYKLDLGDNRILWTALMFQNDVNKINESIRVVGYLRKTNDKRPEEKFLNDYKFMVLAFGLVDFKNSNFLFLSGADMQKKEWMDGKIPSQ